ncbi:hypothetical protein [Pantoea coffeiphila]|uniref:Uncharacterized protein n=1 Tax=Pantoea coffeiphila TaxID=1465635 RepID=A0A2S9I3K3_9GAMM|nr:hypothetical protein [Pantoea coffeiphila]PRD12370.1 hypothetical protein CQW29_26825 [Pantoea coffeiphila]
MTRFIATMLSAVTFFSSTAFAQKSDLAILKKNLSAWQPIEISQKESQITVVSPDAKIDDEIYTAIISSGVCSPIWTNDVPAGYLSGITQISVTNKFKGFGYSLVNPSVICNQMGKLMKNEANVVLLGNTHLYTKDQ